MKLAQALAALKAAGTAQNRKTYARHGAEEPMFGVSYADLAKLHKQCGIDQELAAGLWQSGNHDARVLAGMVGDGDATTQKELSAWAKDVTNHVVGHALATLIARCKHAQALTRKWIGARAEWHSAMGWALVSLLVQDGQLTDDGELAEWIEVIEAGIHAAPNRTRYSMNGALIAIGGYRKGLRRQALAAAKRIGVVDVDHGDTSCKTPDALAMIDKVASHQKEMAARRAARKKASARKAAQKKTAKKKSAKKAAVKKTTAKKKPARKAAKKKAAARRS